MGEAEGDDGWLLVGYNESGSGGYRRKGTEADKAGKKVGRWTR
jgi:hypothetical protein